MFLPQQCTLLASVYILLYRNDTAMVVTNQLAFEMSECMAYSPTNHNGGPWEEEEPQYESITNTTRSGSSSGMDLDPDSNDGYEEIPT